MATISLLYIYYNSNSTLHFILTFYIRTLLPFSAVGIPLGGLGCIPSGVDSIAAIFDLVMYFILCLDWFSASL